MPQRPDGNTPPPLAADARLPLIDRETELEVVETTLARAREGSGRVLLVEGPPGIGKTSIVAAARELAGLAGMRVLHARATEFEREFPHGVVRQCLERPVREPGGQDRLLTGAAALAAPVVLGVPTDADAAPAGILHGLYWLVANLAAEGPLLIAVDDAHWADEPSLRFLAYMARRLESIPVALMVATRAEGDLGEVAVATLAEVATDPATVRVGPQPLRPDAVERLLHTLSPEPVDAGFARACHEATSGNPFLLGELLRTLHADHVPFTAEAAARVREVTPPTVARAVQARLTRLGPEAVALARSAAVLGEGSAIDLAAESAGLDVAEAARVVGALIEAGILDDAAALRFRHPILAGAVRAGMPAPTRAAAHAQAAELLRARGAAADRIALQHLHAPPRADERVVEELREAARSARDRGAPATAAVLLQRALAEPPPPAARPEVLFALGEVEHLLGRTIEAGAHLAEAQRDSSDPVTRGLAISLLATATPGDPDHRRATADLVERELPGIAGRDPELALRLQAGLALEDRLAVVPPLDGSTVGEAVLLGHLALARMAPDASAAHIAGLARAAARQAEALMTEGTATLAYTGLVLGMIWSDRLEEAERVLERGLAVARRRGSTTDFATAMTLRASVRRRTGRLRDAEADARVALAADLDPGWFFARGIAPLVLSLLGRGRPGEAADELRATGLDGEITDSPPMVPVLLARMWTRLAQRDLEAALADWEEAERRAHRLRGFTASWIEDLCVAADLHRARGESDAAAGAAARALEIAEHWDTPGAIGQALHAVARVDGDTPPVDVLRRAVDLLGESPLRLEHARALVSLGGALRRAGHRIESRPPLREGYELAVACGAEALAEAARAELRSSGIRLRREALSGADALTPSERRIADRAVAGLSNPEIAQELFLTLKTVEMHLTNAYRKLGIRRRSELARALTTQP